MGPVTLAAIAESLPVRLSLTKVRIGRGSNPDLPHARRTLYQYAAAVVRGCGNSERKWHHNIWLHLEKIFTDISVQSDLIKVSSNFILKIYKWRFVSIFKMKFFKTYCSLKVKVKVTRLKICIMQYLSITSFLNIQLQKCYIVCSKLNSIKSEKFDGVYWKLWWRILHLFIPQVFFMKP